VQKLTPLAGCVAGGYCYVPQVVPLGFWGRSLAFNGRGTGHLWWILPSSQSLSLPSWAHSVMAYLAKMRQNWPGL